jgi:hypothetical protein
MFCTAAASLLESARKLADNLNRQPHKKSRLCELELHRGAWVGRRSSPNSCSGLGPPAAAGSGDSCDRS